jgi:hypothetical protein
MVLVAGRRRGSREEFAPECEQSARTTSYVNAQTPPGGEITAFQALLLELYESIGNKVKFLNFALTRQFRNVPTASQSLNQRYAGNELILLDQESSLWVG